MSIDQLVTAIATVGFPAIALVFLAKWVKDRIESAERLAVEREERMGKRIDTLEDFIRNDLAEQNAVVTEALKKNTDALQCANRTMEMLSIKFEGG